MDNILTEDEVKQFVNDYFLSKGYRTAVARGHSRGTDIIAQNADTRLIIEVKGCGSRPQMRVNYFLALLGEILQRMDDESSEYYIALPKMRQYECLWDSLPPLAKRRTKIRLLFVDKNGAVEFCD